MSMFIEYKKHSYNIYKKYICRGRRYKSFLKRQERIGQFGDI
jgi:hypothetical protein